MFMDLVGKNRMLSSDKKTVPDSQNRTVFRTLDARYSQENMSNK